jgi:hypothetical protein
MFLWGPIMEQLQESASLFGGVSRSRPANPPPISGYLYDLMTAGAPRPAQADRPGLFPRAALDRWVMAGMADLPCIELVVRPSQFA